MLDFLLTFSDILDYIILSQEINKHLSCDQLVSHFYLQLLLHFSSPVIPGSTPKQPTSSKAPSGNTTEFCLLSH